MGDTINQYGEHGIAKAVHHGSGDIVSGDKYGGAPATVEAALEVLTREVQELRGRLDNEDRAQIDQALGEIRANPSGGRIKALLGKIAGIAALVGDAGVPVVKAGQVVMKLISLRPQSNPE